MNEKDSKSFAINKGDVLLVRSGNVGDYAIVESEVQKAIFGSYLIKFVLNQKLVSNRYFGYFYESPAFKQQLVKIVQASANTNINAENIKSIFISYPSIGFQNKITSFLELIDRRIETQNKIIEELKTLKAVISDLIFKALKCENIIIEKLCSITTGKLDANAGNPNGKYRFYTCAEEYSFIDNYSFDCEAILISGNGANVGYVHQYSGKFNAYQRTYVLYDFKGISPTYLKYYLEVFLKQRINAEKNTGNTPYIRLNTIAKMAIKKPDKTTQEKIVSVLDKISEKLSIEIRKIDLLKKQKSYFLSNLFI